MKAEAGTEKIDEEQLVQNVVRKVILLSYPGEESNLKYSEPKLLTWKSPSFTEKRNMKMLSRVFSKRSTIHVQLINAQEFEYNEIESSVRVASIPKFKLNEIYKKVLSFYIPTGSRYLN